MREKKNLILFGILGALVVVAVLKKVVTQKNDIFTETGFRKLTSEDFIPSDISRIEVYRGDKKDDKIVLVKDGESWAVDSRFNAPGDGKKITDFVEKIQSIEGEFRAESKDILDDFQISDKKGIHLIFSKTEGKEPISHIVLGKSTGGQNSFIRLAGENKIYSVDVNLNYELGIYASKGVEEPKAKQWTDLSVLNLDKETINKIDISTPTRSVSFKKEEVVKKEGKKSKTGEKEVSKAEEKKEYTWKVTKGKYRKIKEGKINQLLSGISNISASDVVDPAKLKKFDKNTPTYTVEILTEGGEKKIISAYRPLNSSDAYVTLNGSEKTLYQIDSHVFTNIFKKGNELFELKGIKANVVDVKKFEIKDGKDELLFEKDKGEKWALAGSMTGIPVIETGISTLLNGLVTWKAVDYTDHHEKAEAELKKSSHSISFIGAKSLKTTLKVADKMIAGSVERYCQLIVGVQEDILLMSEADFEKFFPKKSKLVDMKLVSISKDNVESIKSISKKERFSFTKEKNAWTVKIKGGEAQKGSSEKINNFLNRLQTIKAKNILINDKVNPKKGAAMGIRIKEKNKKSVDLFIHDDNKGEVSVQSTSSKFKYVFDKGNVVFLFSTSQAFISEKAKRAETAKKPDITSKVEVTKKAEKKN